MVYPLVHTQNVPTLKKLAISSVLAHDSQNLLGVKKETCAFVNQLLKDAWDNLKNSEQELDFYTSPETPRSFRLFMLNLEEQEAQGRSFSSPMEREQYLTRRINSLLQKLKEVSSIKGNIPFSSSEISPSLLKQKSEEDALLKIWKSGHLTNQLNFAGQQRPEQLSEIKAWLDDPQNAEQLNNIKGLYLDSLDLLAIPEEIGRLSNLEELSLEDNKITRVYDLNLRKLQLFSLDSNPVTYISPDVNIELLELSLPDQIQNYPNTEKEAIEAVFKLFNFVKQRALLRRNLIEHYWNIRG